MFRVESRRAKRIKVNQININSKIVLKHSTIEITLEKFLYNWTKIFELKYDVRGITDVLLL